MDGVTATLPPALAAAQKLLTDPPADPDVSRGYLDLLGAQISDVPENTGLIQALWASPIGSLLYDNAQTVARRLLTAWQQPTARAHWPMRLRSSSRSRSKFGNFSRAGTRTFSRVSEAILALRSPM